MPRMKHVAQELAQLSVVGDREAELAEPTPQHIALTQFAQFS